MAEIDYGLGTETLYPDTATALANIPSAPCIVIIQCAMLKDSSNKGNVAVRFMDDGTAPTADIGMEINPGQTYVTVTNIHNLKFIGVAANSRLNIKYESWPSPLRRFY